MSEAGGSAEFQDGPPGDGVTGGDEYAPADLGGGKDPGGSEPNGGHE
jgi:hypothetical protein